jgi:hypothetical protein
MTPPQPAAGPERPAELIGLGLILILALLMCIRNLGSLLPWFHYEDELRMTRTCLHLINDRTLDPGISLYPGPSFYINTAAYLAWAALGNLSLLFKAGPGAVLDLFKGMTATDQELIMLSRWVSVCFGLGSLVITWLFARIYLKWRWALLATLLLALNSVFLAMAALAKNETIYLFFLTLSLYAMLIYFRSGGVKRIVLAGLAASLGFLSKNNYQPLVLMTFCPLIRHLDQGKGLRALFRSREILAGAAATAVSAFIISPYTFIHFGKTLETVGLLYTVGEVISTFHSDPHHWWLDRYFYMFSVVLPFLFGVLPFWAIVGGTVHHARKRSWSDAYLLINFVGFIYIFASGSGGPGGGSFPSYFFLVSVPLGAIIVMEWLQDLTLSRKTAARAAGLILLAAVIVTSLYRTGAYDGMYNAAYDDAGPWLREHLHPRDRVLMVSVYGPAPVMGVQKFASIWPQDFTPQTISALDPDVIIIDSWLVAGFRKVYRQLPVAPLADSYLSGRRGFKVIKTFRPDYPGRCYFASVDIEHDMELMVLRKTAADEGKQKAVTPGPPERNRRE